MHAWAVRPWDWNSNLIVPGDFNLDRIGVRLCEAFISTHRRPPTELHAILRAIFDDDKTKHFSDQLAWFSKPDGTCRQQGLSYGQRAGTFDLIPHVFRDLNRSEVSLWILDHYPLWCEF